MKIILYDSSANHRDIAIYLASEGDLYFSDDKDEIIMRLDTQELQLTIKTLIENDKRE